MPKSSALRNKVQSVSQSVVRPVRMGLISKLMVSVPTCGGVACHLSFSVTLSTYFFVPHDASSYIIIMYVCIRYGKVSRLGLVEIRRSAGKRKDAGSIPRFAAHLSLQKL